jgi:hypothetical protein
VIVPPCLAMTSIAKQNCLATAVERQRRRLIFTTWSAAILEARPCNIISLERTALKSQPSASPPWASDLYGPADRQESLATIHAALDAGVTLIDTGDFYGMGHNEMLIGEALKWVPRDQVVVSVKFGPLRNPAGGWSGNDARPEAVKNFLAYSLQRLGPKSENQAPKFQ